MTHRPTSFIIKASGLFSRLIDWLIFDCISSSWNRLNITSNLVLFGGAEAETRQQRNRKRGKSADDQWPHHGNSSLWKCGKMKSVFNKSNKNNNKSNNDNNKRTTGFSLIHPVVASKAAQQSLGTGATTTKTAAITTTNTSSLLLSATAPYRLFLFHILGWDAFADIFVGRRRKRKVVAARTLTHPISSPSDEQYGLHGSYERRWVKKKYLFFCFIFSIRVCRQI